MTFIEKGYTFDDLNLVPVFSTITSRKEPDVSTKLGTSSLRIPIIAAPMNTVCEEDMASLLFNMGGDSVIHRYMSIPAQVEMVTSIHLKYRPFAAIGASGDFKERAKALVEAGCTKLCVDVANGDSRSCTDAVKFLRDNWPDIDIMAGNVCTYHGAWNLEAAGADIIRVGVGSGSVCSTRLVTGFGVPQLTAIANSSRAVARATIVADGGIRGSGDVVKALAMGADAVMVGGLLAGTEQTPGETKVADGRLYKHYSGMASEEGRKLYYGRDSAMFVPEGVSLRVPYKGSAAPIISNLVDGLRVGMSFANARTLEELRLNAEWVEVSNNGRREGNPNRRLHSF